MNLQNPMTLPRPAENVPCPSCSCPTVASPDADGGRYCMACTCVIEGAR